VERRAPQDVTTTFMPQDCTIATVPARFAALGDPHEGIDDAVFALDTMREWAERDERDEGTVPT